MKHSQYIIAPGTRWSYQELLASDSVNTNNEIYNHIPLPKSKQKLYDIKQSLETKQQYMFEQSTVFTCGFPK